MISALIPKTSEVLRLEQDVPVPEGRVKWKAAWLVVRLPTLTALGMEKPHWEIWPEGPSLTAFYVG
jgi:hypothetical protein